ncbi:EAL domain-containing protein [Novosphingobium sp.]|uniref:EAL domain-containing protein n=1 Tax=Novosphingobium sp. TaxID=1874826 RepID=UPI0038BDF928
MEHGQSIISGRGEQAGTTVTRDYGRTQRKRTGAESRQRVGDAFLFGDASYRLLITREWPQISVPMILGVIGVGTVNHAWHDLHAPAVALLGAVLALLGYLPASLERRVRLSTGPRMMLMTLTLGLPMLVYGWGIAAWAESGAVPWLQCLALLITTSLLATVMQSGRLSGVLAAQVTLWSGVTCAASSAAALFTLAIGGVIAIGAYLRQREIDFIAFEKAEEDSRVQTRAQEILADFEETGQGWFWETDRRGMLSYLSRPVADTLHRKMEDLVGRPFTDLFNLSEQAGEGERTLAFHLSARSSFADLTVRASTRDEERWWSITGRPTYDAFNNFQGFRGSGADLTEKKRSQEHASRLAQFDSLTGLSNRFRMSQSLEKILNTPQVHQRTCAVMLLDLDRFKQVNDTLGHPAGDALLKQVAQRLEYCVGGDGRVGRLGGDEFQVILPGKTEKTALANLANRIIESLSQPYSIEGSRVMIGASVGIAIAPEDGMTSEALVRNADLALYAAKDGGRGRCHFYAPDLHSDAEERRQLEEDLRDALAHGGLELCYQPVVQTATEKIAGFEALLRWNHPKLGWISPVRFIPIAEETGLIAQVGEWALRTACQDLARWPGNVRVAVNVSPIQFSNPALPSIVTSALAHSGIDPERLELEITESVFLNDDEGTDAMFRSLKGLGVRLVLDDFGTGYSSLGYLKHAPFDKIKIDQSFVRGATQPGSRNGAIIASIVSLAEALEMDTTAEGVETLDELDLIRQLGVSHVQGYIYERPMSAADAAAKLAAGPVVVAHGPRSARPMRQTMLRKVTLQHGGHSYDGMVRNISQTGALIEGLWNVPAGTIFRIMLADAHHVTATCRWSAGERMGVAFSDPLHIDADGRIAAVAAAAPQRPLRRVPEPVPQRRVG